VQKFDAEGNFLVGWGMTVESYGTPEGIGIDANGRIYITDYDRARVEVYEPDGTFITAWEGGESGRFSRPVAVAFDSQGNVYVSNQGSNAIFKFASPSLP
jgi:DNA-binding beta-propeller fold protein YncE